MAVSIDLGKYKLGWSDTEHYVYKPRKGVNEQGRRQEDEKERE